jgi:AcrR family transcriptional regulator
MPVTTPKPRKRLTREESRAQTRATLIAVGRTHFLGYGLGGAVSEKIAEAAGYSRGALYANFDGKEELFLAVIREEQEHHLNVLRSSEVTSSLKPDDFTTVILNLAHGLAVTQRILGAELSQKSTRTLIQSLFDHLISSA